MQKLILAGNVGKDAVLRRTQGGDPILGFSIAIDNGKGKDSTWYDCAVWGKRGEALSNHVKKGAKLVLVGRPTVRIHEGKAYLGIAVDDLEFMGSSAARTEPATERRDSYGNDLAGAMNDDLPF